MALKAREVLDDCRVGLSMLEDETDIRRWRVHWAASIALIRGVGHVLDKVDGADPIVKQAAIAAFKQWKSAEPKHEIFREFIERERNNLLKEYRSDVHPHAQIALAFEFLTQPESGGAPVRYAQIAEIDENIYRPLLDGPWEGTDARDVLSDAIEWWESELTAIEREVARKRSAVK